MAGSELRARPSFSCFGYVAGFLTLLASLAPGLALAEEAPRAARAEELFREGKALLGERDYARACPLLAASYDLDPGTGVLLALAICHEGEGKLASAAAEYKVAAQRANAEGRADRERVARDRALALEPRLSTLTVAPSSEAWILNDFVIRRSGVVLERDVWHTPVALDGGEYVIEASGPGKKTWRTDVSLAASGERRTITIPPLEDVMPVASAAAATSHAEPPTSATSDNPRDAGGESKGKPGGLTTLQVVGIVAMGAGAAGIGVGTAYAIRAVNKFEDSNENGCDGDVCEGQGKVDREAALSAGNMATIGFAVGVTLAAGGTALFLLGGRSDDPPQKSARSLSANVAVKHGGVMLSIGGSL
jgi:hypothetical protein